MTEGVTPLNREIINTSIVTVGAISDKTLSSLRKNCIDTTALVADSQIRKIICYAAGNFAGIFGNLDDGRKLIINAHVILIAPESAQMLHAVLEDAGCKPASEALHGQILLKNGTPLAGVFVEQEDFDLTAMLRYVRLRLEHFKQAGKVMNRPRQMHIGGEYTLDILRPKLKTLHKLYIQNENGTLTGTHVTENDTQPMQELFYDGQYLTWNAYSGTTSSELFRYRLEVFDDILLGATWRIDGEGPSTFKSPVFVERIQK